MPIYTYSCDDSHCPKAGTAEERLVPFDERGLQVCEYCKRILKRVPIEHTGAPKWKCQVGTVSNGKPTEE